MLKKIIRKIWNIFLYNKRVEKILSHFSELIIKTHRGQFIKILDFGSGFQPNIAFQLHNHLKKKYKVIIHCYDFYDENQLKNLNKYDGIYFKNINDLSIHKEKYDFVIISDVLHHIGVENLNDIKMILNKLRCQSDYILIKDHFEHSYFSRLILIIMDFIGNYYNEVKIPKKYFTKESFKKLIDDLNLKEIEQINNQNYYDSKFLFFNNPKLHFISLIKTF